MNRKKPRYWCLGILASFIIAMSSSAGMAQEKNYPALSLEDCLALARQNNPVLAASREKIRELTADYQAALSRFYPRLSLTSYFYRQPPNRFPPGGNVTGKDLFKREAFTGVLGKQLVFDGFKTYYNSQAAKTGIQAQKQEIDRTADEIAYVVIEAFYRLMEAQENLQVAQEALHQRQEFSKLTEAFFQAGKVTNLDYVRAQSQVSEAQQAVVEARNAIRLAGEILTRVMGVQENVQLHIKGKFPQQFATTPDPKALWQEALKNNPEIKKLDLDLAQSQSLMKAARGAFFPEVSVQGGSDVKHRDLGGTKPEWLGGVYMDFPFFEGGLTRAQVAKASSQYRQLLEKKRDRLDSIKVDLIAAWKDQENARQGVATTRKTLATNEEAFASADALYRHGKAIGLDVLQAQVDLTNSHFNLIRYAVAYEIAKARIQQITGSGPYEHMQPNTNGGQKQ